MPGSGVEGGASYGDLLVTSLLVLGAVCIAAFVAVRFFGRFMSGGRARGTHLLDVVARLPLEPRRSLYVVEVAGKTLLIGTSEMGLSVLSELDGNEVKSRAVPQQSFGDLVRGAWRKRRGLGASEASPETRSDSRSADVSAQPPSDSRSADVSAETRGNPPTSNVSAETRGNSPTSNVSAETRKGSPASQIAAETQPAALEPRV